MNNVPQLGTIIHGTLLPEDLIPAFADELDGYDNEKAAEIRQLLDDWDPDAPDCELLDSAVEIAFDALNNKCDDYLPYCYFGAHEGDGADFGYWICWEAIQQDIADRVLLHVSDLSEVPGDYAGIVLNVNDHGNVTLYSVTLTLNNTSKFEELWSVV